MKTPSRLLVLVFILALAVTPIHAAAYEPEGTGPSYAAGEV